MPYREYSIAEHMANVDILLAKLAAKVQTDDRVLLKSRDDIVRFIQLQGTQMRLVLEKHFGEAFSVPKGKGVLLPKSSTNERGHPTGTTYSVDDNGQPVIISPDGEHMWIDHERINKPNS